MKIQKAIREAVRVVHAAALLATVYLLAAALPGDDVRVNVAGALEVVVLVALVDGLVTTPMHLYLHRRR